MRCEISAQYASGGYALSSIAGWNQTVDDWRLLLSVSAAACGVEIGGQLVATATLICYGQRLGWIGMVLTHPEFRRRGLARGLVGQLVDRAEALGVETVKLDATDEGRGLYESLGFRAEKTVERWQLGSGAALRRAGTSGSPLFDLDTAAFGCDRRLLLERLCAASDSSVASDGYILDRPGRVCRYLGPCVAAGRGTAHSLIEGAIARHPDSEWFWDLLPANHQAVAVAQELGFAPVRKLTRMARGRELRGKEENVYAIGGFEFG